MNLNLQQIMELGSEFYELNRAQNFMFPHDNCDTYTNDQLAALAFGSDHLVEFLTTSLKSAVKLYDLRRSPEFVLLVVSYLRLKFMLEVLDPPRLQARLAQIPKCSAILGSPWLAEGLLDEQPLPRGEGTSSSSLRLEETHWTLDCITTALFHTMIQCVQGYIEPEDVFTPHGWAAMLDMNSSIQAIRGYRADNTNLYELAHKPFLDAWRNLQSLVLSPLIIRFNSGAFVSSPSGVPEHTASLAQ